MWGLTRCAAAKGLMTVLCASLCRHHGMAEDASGAAALWLKAKTRMTWPYREPALYLNPKLHGDALRHYQGQDVNDVAATTESEPFP